MATPQDILEERIERIENIPGRFISKVGATQQELYNELIIILSKLGMDGDNIQLNAANMIRLDALMEEYYEVLRNGIYGSLVAGYIEQYDRQKALSITYNQLEFGFKGSLSADVVYNESRNRAMQLLMGDYFKTNFINVVRDSVVTDINGRASFTQMRTNLFELFSGKERLPLMQHWVNQIASDSYSMADRAYNNEVANDLGLVFGVYAGGLISDSREFCVQRDSKYFHIREVMSWANIEQWQGRYRRTTPQNIADVLGGYNCLHVFAYRSIVNVPKDVIERNIDNGNYKPTAKERELLGI